MYTDPRTDRPLNSNSLQCKLFVEPLSPPVRFQTIYFTDYAGAWLGMLLFDTIIFFMTVYKSITRWREDEFQQDTTLLYVLLRDGK